MQQSIIILVPSCLRLCVRTSHRMKKKNIFSLWLENGLSYLRLVHFFTVLLCSFCLAQESWPYVCVCVYDFAFPFSHFHSLHFIYVSLFFGLVFVFMSVFAANNNQQYASFSSGVNCFFFLFCRSPHSRSMFLLNCLCANIFRTVSSLLWAFCYYCFICFMWVEHSLVVVERGRILSIFGVFATLWFRHHCFIVGFLSMIPTKPNAVASSSAPLCAPFLSHTHICLHASLLIFKHSKSFKVVILVALVPCEWIPPK